MQETYAESASSPPVAPSVSWLTATQAYTQALEGNNRSALTVQAYLTDIGLFESWLKETTYAPTPGSVTKADIDQYLAFRTSRISGVSRARKLTRHHGRLHPAGGGVRGVGFVVNRETLWSTSAGSDFMGKAQDELIGCGPADPCDNALESPPPQGRSRE